jgi:PilZ domain
VDFMTLSSMVVSRDWQEVSVLECILGGLHIAVDVESELARAQAKLAKSKIDALIVDCDLQGTASFLRSVQNSVPLVIVSGSNGRRQLEAMRAAFVFQKPISVEQAVHTLSAARNMILDGRLRYHRQVLDLPVSLTVGNKRRLKGQVVNLSQGGLGLKVRQTLPLAGLMGVSFALPGSARALKVQGEVAWADQRGNVGIRFVEVAPEEKRHLQLWLEQEYFRH